MCQFIIHSKIILPKKCVEIVKTALDHFPERKRMSLNCLTNSSKKSYKNREKQQILTPEVGTREFLPFHMHLPVFTHIRIYFSPKFHNISFKVSKIFWNIIRVSMGI